MLCIHRGSCHSVIEGGPRAPLGGMICMFSSATSSRTCLSLTRCSQGVVLSRTVQMKETGLVGTTFLSRPCALWPRGLSWWCVYLTSAMLRSFCHSCSGRPPSVPAALIVTLMSHNPRAGTLKSAAFHTHIGSLHEYVICCSICTVGVVSVY